MDSLIGKAKDDITKKMDTSATNRFNNAIDSERKLAHAPACLPACLPARLPASPPACLLPSHPVHTLLWHAA